MFTNTALRRTDDCKSTTSNPNNEGESTMTHRNFSTILTGGFVASFLFLGILTPGTASAQPTGSNTPTATPAPTNGNPMACNTMRECLALREKLINMAVQMGLEWSKGVKGSQDFFIDANIPVPGAFAANGKAIKEGSQVRTGLKKDLDNVPTGAANQIGYLGKNPMDMKDWNAWLKANGCEQIDYDEEMKQEVYSPGCDTLAEKVASFAKGRIDKAAPSAKKQNALSLYEAALKMLGDKRVAMLHLAWLMLDMKDWGVKNDLSQNNYDAAKEALDAGKDTFHGNILPSVVDQSIMEQALKDDVPIYIYEKDSSADPIEDKVASTDATGFNTVGGRRIEYSEIPSQYIITIGKLKAQTPFQMAKQAKAENKTEVFGHPFVENNLDKKSAAKLKGLEGTLIRDGQEVTTGKITPTDTGLTVGTESVTFAELNDGTAFVTIGEKSGGGTVDNSGIGLGVSLPAFAVFAPKNENGDRLFTTAVFTGVGIHGDWTLESLPIRFRVGAQLLGSAKNGVASHYTSLASGAQRMLGFFYGEIGVMPRFGKKGAIGLNISAQFGMFSTGGGAGFFKAGPCFFFKAGNVCANLMGGGAATKKIGGSNPTSAAQNQPINGGAFGGTVDLSFYIGRNK